MLSRGFKLKTVSGDEITIKKFIAKGGQGEVYKVDYKGEEKALKWYKESFLSGKNSNSKAFYDNIKNNIEKGKPSNEFLWPIDVTEWQDNTFGYIMDLIPSGYYAITDFLLCHVRFKSYLVVIDACLKIVSAFRILHNIGYSYQDINSGSFFINPNNGDVLICDNDNVAPDKVETGIIGKPRYLAPEIVLGKSKPNVLTDRFSMAAILYILFCLNHPLEGKRYLEDALIPEIRAKLSGSEPLFIMDPNDDSNGPDPVAHRNSIMVWKCLPNYMKEIFINAFSQNSFKNPQNRPTELDWLKALTRFRSEIVLCPCGNEVFTENGESCICDNCGKEIQIPLKLDFKDYSIPAIPNSRIYRCQLGVCDSKDALNPVASVVVNKDTGELCISNKTSNALDTVTPSGEHKTVSPNDKIALEDGMTFVIYDQEIKVKKVQNSMLDETSQEDYDIPQITCISNASQQRPTVKCTKAKITMEFAINKSMNALIASTTKSLVDTMLNTMLNNEEEKTLDLNIEANNTCNLSKKIVIELNETSEVSVCSDDDWDDDW